MSELEPLLMCVMPNPLARAMRQAMTDAEMRLWFRLRPMRQQGLAFRRQSPVGRFILDFECRKAKLGVELDGHQHDQASAKEYDGERTAWLAAHGYEVVRFWNYDVLHRTDAIVDHIAGIAKQRVKELRQW
ncbi:MAG: DUF559 domain-containing protein [Terricaulis sp.]